MSLLDNKIGMVAAAAETSKTGTPSFEASYKITTHFQYWLIWAWLWGALHVLVWSHFHCFLYFCIMLYFVLDCYIMDDEFIINQYWYYYGDKWGNTKMYMYKNIKISNMIILNNNILHDIIYHCYYMNIRQVCLEINKSVYEA